MSHSQVFDDCSKVMDPMVVGMMKLAFAFAKHLTMAKIVRRNIVRDPKERVLWILNSKRQLTKFVLFWLRRF